MFDSSLTYSSELVGFGSITVVNAFAQYLRDLFT